MSLDAWVRWLDAIAYPGGVLLIALVLLFSARRLRALGQAWVGVLGVVMLLGFLVVSLQSPELRRLLFATSRLPVILGLLLTPCVAWFTTRDEGTSRPLTNGASSSDMPWPEAGEAWVAATVLFGVLVLAWFLEPPLGPSGSGIPLQPVHLPWFLTGWQEMRLVTRPFWNGLLWPLLIVGLLAVPYLEPQVEEDGEETSRHEATRLFLFFATVLGWVPLAVGSLLRDEQWRLLGLFGPRDDRGVVLSMGEWAWRHGLGVAPPESAFWRQLPGCLAVGLYLALLWVGLPHWRASRGVFRRYRKQLGVMRYRWGLVLLAALGWVPLKLLVYWFWGVDDWIVLPFWPGGV